MDIGTYVRKWKRIGTGLKRLGKAVYLRSIMLHESI